MTGGRSPDTAAPDAPGAFDLSPSGLSFVFGLELPTGDEGDSVPAGVTPPTVLQLGSGTYDPIVGMRCSTAAEDLALFASAVAQFSGGESDNGLRAGVTTELTLGAGTRLVDRLSAVLALEAVLRRHDELDGSDIENTGSRLLFLTPGIGFDLHEQLSLQATVRWPLWRNVTRAQLVPGPLWSLALQFRF